MNKQRCQRLLGISFLLAGVSIALALVLYALRQNVDLYYTPSQLQAGHIPRGQAFRLGGIVESGSLIYRKQSLQVSFVLTDFKQRVWVQYVGVLPALFREGQGIVARGRLDAAGHFVADQVLAKHDENYHPPNLEPVSSSSSW